MPALEDLNIQSLPQAVTSYGPWSASLHTLDYPANEEGDHFYPIQYFLISKRDEDGLLRIHHISLTHGQQRTVGDFNIETLKSDGLRSYIPLIEKSEPMDIGSLYDQFTKSTARTLLTGHYLATQHKALFDIWRKPGNSLPELKLKTELYWQPIAEEAGGVIRLTTRLYEELIAMGEASTPSLISSLMQTGPRTIHTRLTEARKTNMLRKPGIGSRK
jgi:hypothetical protein